MADMADEATLTMRRIEACVMQAQVNAQADGGDNATTGADLICAFILLSVKSGADPDRALAAMWDHGKSAVAAFWLDARVN